MELEERLNAVERRLDALEKRQESQKVEKVKSSSQFLEAWNMYPNKQGKKEAERHFNASVKTLQDFANIKCAIKNYTQCEKFKNGYVQMGSTWFNDWEGWVNPTREMMGRQFTQTEESKPRKLEVRCNNCGQHSTILKKIEQALCTIDCIFCREPGLEEVQ